MAKTGIKKRELQVGSISLSEKHQYPFDEAQKVGFNCGFSPSTEGYDPKKSVYRTVGEAVDKTLIVDMDLEQSRTDSRRNRHVL